MRELPTRPWLALAALLAGCWDGLPAEPGGSSEAAEEASAAPLIELLYAGDPGPRAAREGDQVRALIWLRRMALSEAQLGQLLADTRGARASAGALEARLADADAAAAAELRPIYGEMAEALTAGEPDEAAAAAWAERLEAARAAAPDPDELRQRWTEEVLDRASAFLDGLSPDQQARAGEALFLLRQAIGPDTTPAAWDLLLGTPWPAGDFSTLRRAASPVELDPLSPASLWTLDEGETELLDGLNPEGRLAIVALAMLHPGLEPACEALLGRGQGDAPGDEAGDDAPGDDAGDGAPVDDTPADGAPADGAPGAPR